MFGTPRKWIEIEKNGNKGQGDLLEGVFLSIKQGENLEIQSILKTKSGVEYFENDGYVFFRKKSVLNLRCLCLYGLHDNSFIRETDKDGRVHYKTNIPQSYFADFSNCKSIEEYKTINECDQPVVVRIMNPNKFFERVCSFLYSLGVKEQDIIIAPVDYIDRYDSRIPILQSPFELLLKDRSFSKQSEVRIIINSNSKKYLDYIKENNGILSVGTLEDITEISNYYFDNMEIERRGNTSIMMSLSESKEIQITDMDYFQLEDLLITILSGNAKLFGLPPDSNTWQDKVKFLADVFYDKYGVVLHVDENRNIYLSGLSSELLEQSRIRHIDNYERDSFEKSILQLMADKKYDEALSLCKKSYEIKTLRGTALYLSATIYKCLDDIRNALFYYNKSYLVDYKRVESLSGIASIYFSHGNYDLAINVYEEIQNEIGYDCTIWGNIGLCYFHLNQYDKAIDFFDKSIKKNPKDAFSFFNKGVALHRKQVYSEAIACVERAIELDPDNIEYLNQYNQYFLPYKC